MNILYKSVIILSSLFTLYSCGKRPSRNKESLSYKIITEIRTTPVKDQGNSNLCWMYAMLATIESEHLMKGDSVNISIAYLAREMMKEKAQLCFFSNGATRMSSRAMAQATMYYMEKYGTAPFSSYKDPDNINYESLNKKIDFLVKSTAKRGYGLERFNESLDELLDKYIGFMPGRNVYMYGAQYSPLEFTHSVCTPGEYIALTSFSHHPFYKSFVLETPDNINKDSFYNLPLDDFMKHINKALMAKHPVCWEGDITNDDFHEGFVTLGNKHQINQSYRQRLFENMVTSDNHAMEIVGIVEKNGERFYKCKNSFGEHWGDNGFVYLSKDYVALNTIAVFMNKSAF